MQFSRGNQADMQLIEAPLSSLENSIKIRRKLLDALHQDDLIARKQVDEDTLKALDKTSGSSDPWAQIESAVAHERALYLPYSFVEGGLGFNSILFRYARLLLRGADERAKPNDARLRIYRFLPGPDRAAALCARAHLCGGRDADHVVLPAAHARMARTGSPAGPSCTRKGLLPGIARDPGRRGNAALRCRRAQAALGRRPGRGRRLA